MKNLTNEELVSKIMSLSWVSGSNDTDDCDDDIFAAQQELLSRLARVSELEAENKAIRTLMDSYNLGGWTDAIAPMKRVQELEAENEVLREMNCALNASSIAGKKAIDKLERIRKELNEWGLVLPKSIDEILAEEG